MHILTGDQGRKQLVQYTCTSTHHNIVIAPTGPYMLQERFGNSTSVYTCTATLNFDDQNEENSTAVNNIVTVLRFWPFRLSKFLFLCDIFWSPCTNGIPVKFSDHSPSSAGPARSCEKGQCCPGVDSDIKLVCSVLTGIRKRCRGGTCRIDVRN